MKSRLSFIVLICAIGLIFFSFTAAAPAASAQIQVLAADPPAADQGMVNLNVLIKGKGFKKGAVAKWFVTGTTDTGGVRVNSTAFVGSTSLVANIDVSDTAVLSKYDIVVANSDGRTGKGIELFTVNKKGATACVTPPTPPACSDALLAGCMDSTFGPDHTGKVLAPGRMEIYDIAVQRVGDQEWTIAVGQMPDLSGASRSLWTVVRFSPEGILDTTFGSSSTGYVQEYFGGNGGSRAEVVLIQPDGKIVVSGDVSVQKIVQDVPGVARYDANGRLDVSFGTGGRTTVPLGRSLGGSSDLALQSDGKIVSTGCYLYPCSMAVFRLNPNGSLDATFNANTSYAGRYFYPPYPSYGEGVVIQTVQTDQGPEERIVVAGAAPNPATGYRAAALFRLTSRGELDTTFGDLDSTGSAHTGVALTAFGPANIDAYFTLQLDSSNRLVAAGESDAVTGEGGLILARYTRDGSLDTSFATAGTYMIPAAPGAYASALQADGRILVAGTDSGLTVFNTLRFLDNGAPDPSFGANGAATVDFGARSVFLWTMALQSDGKFITAGKAGFPNGSGSCTYGALARQYQ